MNVSGYPIRMEFRDNRALYASSMTLNARKSRQILMAVFTEDDVRRPTLSKSAASRAGKPGRTREPLATPPEQAY